MADITDGLKELRLHSMAGDWTYLMAEGAIGMTSSNIHRAPAARRVHSPHHQPNALRSAIQTSQISTPPR